MSDTLNPENHVRQQRRVSVVHGEAFQLMLYRSKDGQHEVWFWNSRDGVTPFGCTIGGVELTHAMRGYQIEYSAALPLKAQYVWIDYTPEEWASMMHRRWQAFANAPVGEWHDPAEFVERWPTPESFASVEPFQHGSPRSISRDEFLMKTTSWMGKTTQ